MTVTYNIYGKTPCPRCLQPYRYSIQRAPHITVCDCGHNEPNSAANTEGCAATVMSKRKQRRVLVTESIRLRSVRARRNPAEEERAEEMWPA